ncbi:hypothetical protein L0F63_003991 [Massospora cicadina]|nr:hypothetical protein L0F63_003991 [Massospora cicadina]
MALLCKVILSPTAYLYITHNVRLNLKLPLTMAVALFSESTVSTSLTLGAVPSARVGPSITALKDKLYVFGGRLIAPTKISNELFKFSIPTMAWEPIVPTLNSPHPSPRYFHSAVAFGTYLIIIGGQGETKRNAPPNILNDICFFDLLTKEWEILQLDPKEFPPRYAHLSCVLGRTLVIVGGQDADNQYLHDLYFFNLDTRSLKRSVVECGLGSYRSTLSSPADALGPITIFSNTRFNNPLRELLSLDEGGVVSAFQFPSSGQTLPPAFRFPEGFVIGNHLVMSGTYISNNVQSYCIWSLNLEDKTWSRIDTGSSFARGSWNRGVLHPTSNQFFVFGHREREIVFDYNQRRINFNHISIVNLEAFNIYRRPAICKDRAAIDLGKQMMFSPALSNFALLTNDEFRIHINSGLLRARWPNLDAFLYGGQDALPSMPQVRTNALMLQESYPVVQAFVQFIYTNALEGSLGLDLLGKLLVFARNYAVHALSDRVAAELHAMLDIAVAPRIYQVASLAQRDGLRLRSLSVMIRDRQALLGDAPFWESYPPSLRDEILRYMPPNFQAPVPPRKPPPGKLPKPLQDESGADTVREGDVNAGKDIVVPLPPAQPKKKTSGASFLKFGGRRPSLASFFSFSSSSNASQPPAPPGAPPPPPSLAADKAADAESEFVRSLYDVGLS